MNQHPTTLEAQYVSRTVGPALSKGLAEIIEKRPADPVEYLAHYLIKHVENKKIIDQVNKHFENDSILNSNNFRN